ncbi:MAG: DUF4358 domain-containing protein [Eubacteriales bacterium]
MKKLFMVAVGVIMSLALVGCTATEEVAESPNKDIELQTVVDNIKNAYGTMYYPNMVVEGEMIEEFYGLTEDMYDEVFIEIPMISGQSDILMAIKVADGQQEAVLELVTNYRDTLVNDMLQYPSNQLKLQASKVIEYDGFIFLVSLGEIPMEVEEEGEEAVIAKAAEMNAIAEEAIAAILE